MVVCDHTNCVLLKGRSWTVPVVAGKDKEVHIHGKHLNFHSVHG
jgi:hypothetical protein